MSSIVCERQCELAYTSCWMFVLPARCGKKKRNCDGLCGNVRGNSKEDSIQRKVFYLTKIQLLLQGQDIDFLFPDVWCVGDTSCLCFMLFICYSVWQQLMYQNTVSVKFCFLDNFMWSENNYVWLEWLKAKVCGMCVIQWYSFFCLKYVCAYTAVLLKSQQVNKHHQDHIFTMWPWFVGTIFADKPDMTLSVLGYSMNESSIITSLMGLEWGQSFMTLCFIAMPEITMVKWEGCRYFLWSYFLTRGCLWLMSFPLKSHLGNPKE